LSRLSAICTAMAFLTWISVLIEAAMKRQRAA
jgi:hypothetical protein